jgi:tetratricopeptide (TPR) repeat protein
MKGRAAATILSIFLSAGISFAQIYSADSDVFGSGQGSMDRLQSSSISGVVVGSDGAPVPDVRIEIRNDQTSRVITSAYTNNSGAFQFNNLPLAPYDVAAMRGMSESHEHLALGDVGANLRIRLTTANSAATQADGHATVSVAEYKVPQKARDAFHKAEQALAKNRPDDAAKNLSKALEIYPDYAPALTLRGVMSLDSSKPESAINDFDKAIHSDPGYAMAYTAMAAAQNQLNKFDDAVRSAERAVTLAPRSWQSYFEMAKAYVGKTDYQHALQQVSRAQELVPTDYAPIHLVRAHVMLALKNYSNAIDELQAFLKLSPQDPNSGAVRQTLEKLKAFTASATTTASLPAQ